MVAAILEINNKHPLYKLYTIGIRGFVFTMRITHWPVISNTIAALTLKHVANQQLYSIILISVSTKNIQFRDENLIL
jgi:hypothetical protein